MFDLSQITNAIGGYANQANQAIAGAPILNSIFAALGDPTALEAQRVNAAQPAEGQMGPPPEAFARAEAMAKPKAAVPQGAQSLIAKALGMSDGVGQQTNSMPSPSMPSIARSGNFNQVQLPNLPFNALLQQRAGRQRG